MEIKVTTGVGVRMEQRLIMTPKLRRNVSAAWIKAHTVYPTGKKPTDQQK